MDPLEALAARLVGTWRSVFVSDKNPWACIRFMEDLKYVGIERYEYPPGSPQFREVRMYCELESESVLRMRFYKDRVGEVRNLHFEGETLVMEDTFPLEEGGTESQTHVYHCHRLNDEEIPEWFEEQFQKAMARPWF